MQKEFSPFRLAVCALCLFSLFGLRAYAQDRDRDQDQGQGQDQGQDRDQDRDRRNDHPNGIVQDWSRRHVVYPRVGPIESLIQVQHDPRAILSWQAAEREDWHRARDRWRSYHASSDLHRDWSISLGGGTTAPSMYPAKYTFDINATPTCIIATGVPVPDFIVFPVNVAGSASQPNIVAFQDLYSGTTGAPGICNTKRPTYFTGDTVASAATFWSYDITAGGGIVATSPALSLDGTRVAFVETGGGSAHFHVLAWNGGTTSVAGDGVTTTNSQLVTSPKVITTGGFATLAPVAGSGTVSDLVLGSANDTLSSPFVVYNADTAYVGNDAGVLFRVINVFCATTACTGGGTPAPSLDSTWGSSGALTIGGTCTGSLGKLTGPVVATNGNVYVGCADGKLYGFTSTGTALTHSPVTVGDGTATGGIVDPPLVDVVNKFIYVVSGSNGAGSSVLVQASASATDLGTPVIATLGGGTFHSLHAPAFNEAYYSSGTPANWLIYEWGVNTTNTLDELFGVTFTTGHVMTSGAAADTFTITGSTVAEWSPLTEILSGSTDRLFASGLTSVTPNVIEENITTTFPTAISTSASEGSGTSGIVVDNVSALAQASSVYFGAQVANTAVKLTQAGLN